MNATQAGVAQQTFVSYGAEDAGTTGDVEAKIDDPPRSFHSAVFGRKDLRRPLCAVIHPVRLVLGDAFRMRSDRFQLTMTNCGMNGIV